MARYRVRRDGEVAGVWRRAGEVIELDVAQAQHLAPPLGGAVEPAVAEAEEPAAPVVAAPVPAFAAMPPLRTRKGR